MRGVCCGSNDSGQATYYPHETDCGKFYECNFGRPILFVCPEGLYFDPILNTCNWNVDCGNLSTSTVVPRTTPSSVILTKLIQNDSVILP
ncbi:hypothetical protein NQ314_007178 [Rhamnusium bicolor]|uniref:Chitin-binding type-2 domain-containing protein n=1 Tax=Rhamnusium bicolor TaxID=1586634 RepID=A0AAV8YSN5_9CUCU|nr:hypothetical protein NQ314_007178 [Rhamnusium bicolor]